ncbi:MAG: hypothetical protein Fur0010_10990 [Bdellovibrio sp.]
MKFLKFIAFVISFFTLNAWAEKEAQFPLKCGLYEIGAKAELIPSSLSNSLWLHLFLKEGTLSKTELKPVWKNNPQRYEGIFFIKSKIKILKRVMPYSLEGELVSDASFISIKHAAEVPKSLRTSI